MENDTRTRADIMADISDAIIGIMIRDLRWGANDYAYVRVYPDGDVVSSREPSRCVPMSEYYREEPHPVTVWSASGCRGAVYIDSGMFEWDEVEAGGGGALKHNGKWWTLSDRLVDPIDIESVLAEIDRSLDEHEWLPANEATT